MSSEQKSGIGIILLAAGSSSRMGTSKQMLPVGSEPLLLKSVQTATASKANYTLVVLGANAEAHQAIIQNLAIDIIINPDWKKGMGNSLKAGINYLLKKETALNAVIILVCDQPMLSSDHLNKLIINHQQTNKPIIASGYSKTAGVPVLFDKMYFETLLKLNDEQGAKKIIQENQKDVYVVDFPGGEIDLDTIADYNLFIIKKQNESLL